jgi:hypothetical protein
MAPAIPAGVNFLRTFRKLVAREFASAALRLHARDDLLFVDPV